MTTKRAMQISLDIYIKAYEIDAMGIVSNIVYVKWFEDMRHIFLDQFYTYKEMMTIGHSDIRPF
jgi:acyl-CoA thioester hydrolase